MERKKAAIAFLGADSFDSNKLTSRRAFLNSKESLQKYFDDQNHYEIKSRLDLFGSADTASQQVEEVDKFIDSLKNQEIEFFFLIYIGHGEFRTAKDDYFWAVADTNSQNPFNSSIDVKTLGHSLKKLRRSTKCICVIDCCFSAAAAAALMSGEALGREVSRRTEHAIAAAHGSLVISSSAVDNVSYISGIEEMTLFTRALMGVLMPSTSAESSTLLDPTELVERCERWMTEEEPEIATSPQLIAPFQQGKPLLREKLFPILAGLNTARVAKLSQLENPSEMTNIDAPLFPNRDEVDRIREIVHLGETLERDLVLSLDKSSIKKLLYAYYSRTKGVDAIAKKIERKRTERLLGGVDQPYQVDNVTDVVGFRLITLFRDDIAQVLHSVCKFLVGSDGERKKVSRFNPFQSDPLILEARAYYSDTFPGARHYALEAQEILSSYFNKTPHGIEIDVIPKDEYSSIHIVFHVKSEDDRDGEIRINLVPVEFQIRSVFEDTWAQIDHKLRYTTTRLSSGSGDDRSYLSVRDNISPAAEKSLKLLKRFLDNSGDLAEIIRDQVEDNPPSFLTPTPAMDSAEDFGAILESLGGSRNDFKKFQSMLLIKDDLDKQYQSLGPIENSDQNLLERLRKSFGKLGEDLNSLFESSESLVQFSRLGEKSKAVRFYYYSLRMEEAFCRVFSARASDLSEIREARSIYTHLITDFGDHPPLHYRLAQSHKSLGDIDKAIDSMNNAIRCLETDSYKREQFDYKLSKKQYDAIIGNVDRLLGYYIWARAQHTLKGAGAAPSDEVRKLVLEGYDEAVAATLKGFERSEGKARRRNLNNIVSYLNDAIALTNELDVGKILPSMAGKSYADFFEELVSSADLKTEEVRTLETFASGYRLLRNHREAQAVARRIVNAIQEGRLIAKGEIPADEIQEILDTALEILRDAGPGTN